MQSSIKDFARMKKTPEDHNPKGRKLQSQYVCSCSTSYLLLVLWLGLHLIFSFRYTDNRYYPTTQTKLLPEELIDPIPVIQLH